MRNKIDEGSDEKMHWFYVFDIAVSSYFIIFDGLIPKKDYCIMFG